VSRAGAIVAGLAALALAACGDDEQVEPAGPATLAPAGTTVYGESILRPEGGQRDAVESSLSLLLDTDDPGGLIVSELNQSIAEDDSEITYEGDIEPWLGERGAVFFTDLFAGEDPAPAFSDDGERGGVLVDVTDAEAAEAFIEKASAEEDSAEEASYEDVGYTLIDDRLGMGLVGDHLVLADEETFHRVVDTDSGEAPLAEDQDFSATIGEAGESAASLYVDVPAIVAQADDAGELSDSDREALDTVFAGVAEESVAATLEAQPAGFGLELSYGSADLPFLAAADESALLRELPESAWLAAGFNDLGDAVGSFFRQADDLGIAGEELALAERRFLRDYGLRLEEFYGPLGDGAVFASGRGIFGTGGGLVVETEGREAAAKVLAGLRRESLASGENVRPLTGGGPGVEGFSLVIPDAPGALNFIAAGERLVVAYGEDATAAALEPDETLESSEEFGSATAALGEEFAVGLFLDFGPVTELLDLAAATDPSIEQALPYFEAIDFLITGSSSESGRDQQRIFLGLEEDVSGPAT
jgi:Protein of unknown function (DUF3352)